MQTLLPEMSLSRQLHLLENVHERRSKVIIFFIYHLKKVWVNALKQEFTLEDEKPDKAKFRILFYRKKKTNNILTVISRIKKVKDFRDEQ